ncbi:co-chaperone GrpE [Aeromicrobium marinum DSM 15272]|uniref:Protein GrpE n=1 Tax=Aeromicrobium marinum DSM 15272 TaxID=585531 RepID=E2SF87_9ACTN|nr:nucleotide exchange factor GrpE [Aeromicrobium marinum]EFQ82172.1 co-chaperone GrpE [Aeromicrobium marinum DSM 15272]
MTGPGEPGDVEESPAGETPPAAPADDAAGDAVDGSADDAAGSAGADDPLAAAQADLAERTADLQRLQAEYVNYKRRVDRDRELVKAQGEAKVLDSLLTVLDDLGRAEEHGELTGGFKAVADALRSAVGKHHLEAFGAEGDAFDPAVHEAVFQVGESSDVTVTTVGQVLRIGYRVGDRVLRPATVGVVEPGDAPEAAESDTTSAGATDDPTD